METLGDFELYEDQLIGRGAWGDVFKGRQVSLDRPVAIKILKKELTADEEFVRRFRRESSVLAKLVDEHIIHVYAAGSHRDSHYFVMEYVPGIPLQKFIGRGRKFTTPEIIHLGLSVAWALKSAWESPAKIIHRDIKPSNIMVSFSSSIVSSSRPASQPDSLTLMDFDITEARIKVMDFGLAKLIKEEKDATMVGTVIGTPKYISPEQGLGNPVDIRTDIYSLGIVLYEMATGTIPFESETAMSLIRHHIYDTPLAPSRINPEMPARLEAIILKCIEKDPNKRYTAPQQLIADLESLKQQSSVYASKTTPTSTASETPTVIPPASKKKSNLSLLTISLIIFGVVFLIGSGIAGIAVVVNRIKQKNNGHNQIEILLSQAENLMQANDLTGAENILNEARAKSPDSPRLKDLADKLTKQKELQTRLTNSLKQARQYLDQNKLPEARQIITEALVLAPGNTETNKLLSELKQKEEQLLTKKTPGLDEDKPPARTIKEKKWTSNRWGFEVTLPEEWEMTILEKEEEARVASFYDKNASIGGSIMMEQLTGDCDEYLDSVMANVKSSFESELINETGGKKEGTMIYTAVVEGTKWQYYTRVFDVDGVKLRFSAYAKAKFFHKYQKTFEKYAQTLKAR